MVVPGIYVQEQQYNLNSLKIDNRCLSGFAGITECGPINTPVKIRSFDEYLKVFGGFDTAGMLPCSIYNYFRCGGKECVVVRIADEKTASCAKFKIKQNRGKINFEANSPGHWGNYISASIWKEDEKYFSVSLTYQARTENFIHLSCDKNDERYIVTYINTRSSLCKVKITGFATVPAPVFMRSFSSGNDGIADLKAGNYIGYYNGLNDYAGIGCFESFDDISLIAVPDICWLKKQEDMQTVQMALIAQAERFPNRFAILDVPERLDIIGAANWVKKNDKFICCGILSIYRYYGSIG